MHASIHQKKTSLIHSSMKMKYPPTHPPLPSHPTPLLSSPSLPLNYPLHSSLSTHLPLPADPRSNLAINLNISLNSSLRPGTARQYRSKWSTSICVGTVPPCVIMKSRSFSSIWRPRKAPVPGAEAEGVGVDVPEREREDVGVPD